MMERIGELEQAVKRDMRHRQALRDRLDHLISLLQPQEGEKAGTKQQKERRKTEQALRILRKQKRTR